MLARQIAHLLCSYVYAPSETIGDLCRAKENDTPKESV
jgi:hypothetical protein